MPEPVRFNNLFALAEYLRDELENKKFILLYAYNGVGKTRLSTEFKNLGKDAEDENKRDTLYFNAFTEDLFTWDNDLEGDSERSLKINADSNFFAGLGEMEMDTRIRPLLGRYADFDFRIDTEDWQVVFSREVPEGEGRRTEDGIKISRGEENIFIWCFFLAIVQLTLDGAEAYNWVKYVYIDDPISSLDEQNAIAVAAHLAQMLKGQDRIKVVTSSHHTLFFNVLCNEINNSKRYFLSGDGQGWQLRDTGDTPRFYHVAMLRELYEATESGKLYTYHFTVLRSIMEKAATFHGFNNLGDVIKRESDDEDGTLHFRYIQLLSHGNYSLFEPVEMMEENKQIFQKILSNFMTNYRFNPELFPVPESGEAAA